MKDSLQSSWWSIPKEKIVESLRVDLKQGLSDAQVIDHRKQYGSNNLLETKPRSIIDIILESVQEPMMLLLLAIAVLSFIFGKIGGAIAMILEVVMYATLELINKFRTDRIMFELKNMAHPTAKVIRNGKEVEIKTNEIVVGDILILSQGVFVAADARLLLTHGLSVNQSSLTGESLPVEKDANIAVDQHVTIAERKNSIFSGTMILNGEGTAIVMAVGQQSEFGKIAQHVQGYQDERTVVQIAMDQLAKALAIFAVVVSIIIPAIGFFRGLELQEMVLTWLALTFLMIPCQPPIIITMALSLAAFMLAKKQVVAKRLFGIEGIGQVSAVVSDKTGTITESKMSLDLFLTSSGPTKVLPEDLKEKIILALPDYCNHVTDKTVALAVGNDKKNNHPVKFSGFSELQPWRDLVYKDGDLFMHLITGNPETIVNQSTLSVDLKNSLIEQVRQQASLGSKLTTYAVVYSDKDTLDTLQNLTFLAVAVMKDPVRPGVKDAITALTQAGIKTFIVTGDHTLTAQTIALEVGIPGKVITGEQFASMDDKELAFQLGQSNIFARMEPMQKFRLVQMLKQQQEVVAVIGDGVNDAPALKAADVGIAMGQIGTDLAKEVSDLILTDDNYVHIPDAIAIGRTALDNFKKGLTFYLSAKFILLIMFIVPLFLGIPFPFVPMQIILIELLMDLASSTIFVVEDIEPEVMQQPSQKITEFLGKPLLLKIFKSGIALAVGIVFLYVSAYYRYDVNTAQTVALVAWLLGHILLALNLKQEHQPLTKQGFFANYFGVFWMFVMVGISWLVTSVSFLYPYLKTTALPLTLWLQIIGIVFVTTCWIEVVKLIKIKKIA
ncbi:MAG: cation-transporting P-type ATPase [Candidatus Babeliales bacterium]|jgi:Ca2+-transporting ATPase